MSGHSKWSTIKHKKGKEDAKRGKVFTKISKELTVAAKAGGGDPMANARLRLLIEKAKDANMPQDNVTRAIKKGTGEIEGVSYEAAMYEGYGPCGIAVVIETLSDNKNRTVADLRHVFTKMGGNMGASGAVVWMFDQKAVVRAEVGKKTEDELLELLLSCDVQDIQVLEGMAEVTGSMPALSSIRQALKEAGCSISSSEVEWVAKEPVTLAQADEEKVYAFLEALENLDDVQHVYANAK